GLNDHAALPIFGNTTNCFYRVNLFGIDRVGSAQGLGLIKFSVVNIHGDDLGRPSKLSALDGRHTDTAAADNRHGFTAFEFTGINGGPTTGHYTASQQTNSGILIALQLRIDLGALTGSHQSFFGKRPDTQGGFYLGAVF